MSNALDRRGLLRGLASLPLVGGKVAIIGQPTAAAVPVTERLLHEYENWLVYERHKTAVELYGSDWGERYSLYGSSFEWHRGQGAKPSARAAVVLAAVGCPLP